MKLLAVEVGNFRNLIQVLIEPGPRFNVLAGDNAQGKTNLLEAIYWVATLTSFRASRNEEMVRFGVQNEVAARVRARLERQGLCRLHEVELQGAPLRKLAKVDGKPVRATIDHFGGFNVVLFGADDLALPRGAPEARRRFLDRAVWNADPALLADLRAYQRVLRSRNALLRDPEKTDQVVDLIEVYESQLAQSGAAVVGHRRRYLRALEPRVVAAFERITRSGLSLAVRYASDFSGADGQLAEELARALVAARARDLARGFTGVGPHTDDLELILDGREAGLHASQGQLRALMLALKIAEIEQLEAVLGEPPILLLDDVSSELDATRNAQLFDFLHGLSAQVFITTTHRDHVLWDSERRDFRVVEGAILW